MDATKSAWQIDKACELVREELTTAASNGTPVKVTRQRNKDGSILISFDIGPVPDGLLQMSEFIRNPPLP